MALTGTTRVTLSYQSKVGDDGEVAVYMTGQIKEDGTSTSSKTINNLALYEANKTECRADIAEFEQLLYDLEDNAPTESGSAEKEGGE